MKLLFHAPFRYGNTLTDSENDTKENYVILVKNPVLCRCSGGE